MLDRTKWLLLALAHRRGRPLSPAQVQKAMFVFGKEMPAAAGTNFFAFRPYNYGPFDAAIYSELEGLAREELVTIIGAGTWRSYAVTPTGMEKAAQLEQDMDARALNYLHRIVDWVASLPFPALIRSIYAKYPEYKVNSVFVD